MPIVEVNGESIEFPDDMSDEQIAAAIRQANLSARSAPSEGGSIADPIGQGLSFGFSDELAGLAGAGVNSVLNLFDRGTGDSFGEAYRGIRDAARENQAAFAQRNPGTALAAEIGGGVLTGGLGAARAGAFTAAKNAPSILGRLAPIAATGAVQGGIYGAGTSETGSAGELAQDALRGAALGGLTAPILPAIAGGARAVSSKAVQVKSSPIYRQAVDYLENKVGIRLTSGQKTGSDPLKATETTLSQTFLGGAINRALDRNRQKLQSAMFKMAGFEADDVASGLFTRDALDRAADKFSTRYARLFAGTKVNLRNKEFLDAISKIGNEHSRLIPPLQRSQVNSIVEEFLKDTNTSMSGRTYQKIRSRLGRLSKNRDFGDLYRDLKKALDEAFFASGGSRMGRKVVDLQYGRYKDLLDIFKASGAQQTAEGHIPLAMAVRKAAQRPDKEWDRLVRSGQMVLGDPVANSGTPARFINTAAFLGGGIATGGADAGLLAVGVPFGLSQTLSRGYTGSNVVDRLIQGGLLTAPVVSATTQ